MPKYSCDNSPIIDIVKKGLKHLEVYIHTDPSKKKAYNHLRKAFSIYKRDCAKCKGQANNDATCLNAALTKLFRQIPHVKDTIYPWQNYEWDYGNFVDNNYSAAATGSTKRGSWSALFKNTKIFLKFFKAMIFSPNPNKRSVAGGMNKHSDFPIYGCQGNNANNCRVWNSVKMSNLQRKPYKDKFFNKRTRGENSSSYYAKVGVCPRKDLKTSRTCIKKGHTWIPDSLDPKSGSCFQDRYMYINNTPGLMINTKMLATMAGGPIAGALMPKVNIGKLKGFVPAVKNDALAMSPGNLFKAFMGKSVDGYMSVQSCPKIEGFENMLNHRDYMQIISLSIAVITTLLLIKKPLPKFGALAVILFLIYKFYK